MVREDASFRRLLLTKETVSVSQKASGADVSFAKDPHATKSAFLGRLGLSPTLPTAEKQRLDAIHERHREEQKLAWTRGLARDLRRLLRYADRYLKDFAILDYREKALES